MGAHNKIRTFQHSFNSTLSSQSKFVLHRQALKLLLLFQPNFMHLWPWIFQLLTFNGSLVLIWATARPCAHVLHPVAVGRNKLAKTALGALKSWNLRLCEHRNFCAVQGQGMVMLLTLMNYAAWLKSINTVPWDLCPFRHSDSWQGQHSDTFPLWRNAANLGFFFIVKISCFWKGHLY